MDWIQASLSQSRNVIWDRLRIKIYHCVESLVECSFTFTTLDRKEFLNVWENLKFIKGLYFIFIRLTVSKLRISSMLLNVECTFYYIFSFILWAWDHKKPIPLWESGTLSQQRGLHVSMTLEVLLLGSVATGLVSHVKLDPGKRPNQKSFKVSNEVAKRGQMRDSRVSLLSQAWERWPGLEPRCLAGTTQISLSTHKERSVREPELVHSPTMCTDSSLPLCTVLALQQISTVWAGLSFHGETWQGQSGILQSPWL